MRGRHSLAAACGAALLLQACAAAPMRTTEIGLIDEFSGYRYNVLGKVAPKSIDKTAVLVSFSGGGTRAAALADGALRALGETMVPARDGTMVPLSSQIDLVSSVSGGSVTATYFALYGLDGLPTLEKDFLHKDIMGTLVKGVLRNPFELLHPRVDAFDNYLDGNVFAHKTFADLLAAPKGPGDRRPYTVLNATDMASGSVFSFNQDQFDLICANIGELKIADAVASSAAFPVALSALTLKNRAPCDAQRNAVTDRPPSWLLKDGQPEPKRIAADRTVSSSTGVSYPAANDLTRFRAGTTALHYLNRDGGNGYIQLLDGGLADNLGLTLPFAALTSPNQSPSFLNPIASGGVDKLLFLVVNARGEAANDYGKRNRSPGAIEMLETSIDTPIDATSFQLVGRLDEIVNPPDRADVRAQTGTVLVDFDMIADAGCRAHFHGMATSWMLNGADVDDLIAIGKALVLQSPDYARIVHALNGVVPPAQPTVEEICRKWTWARP